LQIIVRPYILDDFDALLRVQREAFPPPFPEELLWKREQIEAHTSVYPEGAMVAVCDGEIAGSATSLRVTYTGAPHTWEEISAKGYIRGSHEPDGDSLYGIDLCVRPAYRGKGIAHALYEARKQLVMHSGLKRFIAGCRIPGYRNVSKQLSAAEYVRLVADGERHDLVLSFMLKQGMLPLQVLDDYLEDAESCDKAILVEWANPNHTNYDSIEEK
jgi:ribosomal protein S18 acetylase RimI-like enzyme